MVCLTFSERVFVLGSSADRLAACEAIKRWRRIFPVLLGRNSDMYIAASGAARGWYASAMS